VDGAEAIEIFFSITNNVFKKIALCSRVIEENFFSDDFSKRESLTSTPKSYPHLIA